MNNFEDKDLYIKIIAVAVILFIPSIVLWIMQCGGIGTGKWYTSQIGKKIIYTVWFVFVSITAYRRYLENKNNND